MEIAIGALWYGPHHAGVVEDIPLNLAILTQVGVGQRGYDSHQMAELKTNIAYGLQPDRPFLINGDIENIDEVKRFARRYPHAIMTYGRSTDCDFYGQVNRDGQLTVYHNHQVVAQLVVKNFDHGLISNIIGTLAAGHILLGSLNPAKIDQFEKVCYSLAQHKTTTLTVHEHQVTLIDDTHNAELLSMQNFIDYAENYKVPATTKKYLWQDVLPI